MKNMILGILVLIFIFLRNCFMDLTSEKQSLEIMVICGKAFKDYRPKKKKNGRIDYTNLRKKLLKNVYDLYNGNQMTINAFKKGIFKIFNKKLNKEDEKDENFSYSPTKSKQNFEESVGERVKLKRQKSDELNEMITEKDNTIKKELFKKHFNFQNLSDMQKSLSKTQGTRANKQIVKLIKSRLIDLNREIEKMSQDECRIEKPKEIIDAVTQIFDHNNNTEQKGYGLKILTLQQMLSRLPISLAQLKAGNNSEKLKNERRQLLHSLYRSKKLSKKIYEHLMKII